MARPVGNESWDWVGPLNPSGAAEGLFYECAGAALTKSQRREAAYTLDMILSQLWRLGVQDQGVGRVGFS